jgi:hypothetical protein
MYRLPKPKDTLHVTKTIVGSHQLTGRKFHRSSCFPLRRQPSSIPSTVANIEASQESLALAPDVAGSSPPHVHEDFLLE